jgi:uncharacterized protein (TIGR03086 family)
MAEPSDDTFQLIDHALDRFDALVRAVPANRWSDPTPCAEWSVRDVVNHVVGEHLWAPPLLRGETIAQVGDRFDGDVLGDSPTESWERASAESRQAWRTASPEFPVHLSFGDTPALEYGQQMLLDLVIHGWDVARGAGLDETLDPAAAAHVLSYVQEHAKEWEAAGVFAAPVDADAADPVTRLLGCTGRRRFAPTG